MLREWEKLPKFMQTEEVRLYYDSLEKKKISLALKREFDVFAASVMLVTFSPVLIAISIMIVRDSKGGVFYRQERVTQYGRKFRIFKFRTMVANADKIGTQVTVSNDSRVTKVGEKLRKYRLDELPQLINIILGDMSLIGPRPDTPMYLDKYTEEERIILTVRPGVTGYNQAINRNSVLTKEKLKNDVYYVKHLSLIFDIKIIFMTVATVLGNRNVNRENVEEEGKYILQEDGTKSENIPETK